MGGFLSRKVEEVRRGLERDPPDDSANMARALAMPPARDFAGALRTDGVAVIAEVKRASPSAGALSDADATELARAYEAAGAASVSVLTDERDFGGTLADLVAVRASVGVPVLRKDFLLHPSQLIESRAAGADAVLLIASCLTDAELAALLAAADDLGLGSLVESHGDRDLDRAVRSGARVVGVNARDLETLEVDLRGALARLRRIPDDRVAVLESGVAGRADVEEAGRAGASAVLVGEALMRSADPGRTLRELLGVPR